MLIVPIKILDFKFDKKMSQKYNMLRYRKRLSADCFQSSFMKQNFMHFNPEERKLLESLKNSKLSFSPVAYIIGILDDYFNKKISNSQFSERMINETKFAQYAFSKMSSSEIQAGKKLFEKEFKLADEIGKLALAKTDDDSLKVSISKLVQNYNKNA